MRELSELDYDLSEKKLVFSVIKIAYFVYVMFFQYIFSNQ